MTTSFEGKDAYEIAIEMCSLVSKHRTETQFAALAAQDEKTRDFVVNTLEEKFLKLSGNFVAMIEEQGVAKAKKRFTSLHAPDTTDALNEEQALAELGRQLAKLKGEAANPLLKNFVQEISKLPAEQTWTENTVYGALFDALETTLRDNGMLATLEDRARLVKIDEALGWRVSVGVKEHFNKAGKYQEFATAPTDAENAEQKAAMKGILAKSGPDSSLASLKMLDVFMRVARRVGNDAELAAILPAAKFDAKDVDVLEKNNLPSLAALVKTAIENKPK